MEMFGIEEKVRNVLQKLTLDEKLRLCTGDGSWHTWGCPRLGIPSILMSDGTNGVRLQKENRNLAEDDFAGIVTNGSFDSDQALSRTFLATCFPSGSTLSCSWDRKLFRRVAYALAKECKGLGINVLLGPGINIRRHPLTARNFEYLSEDPFLTGHLGAEMVLGLKEKGIGAVVKHFACHNSDTHRTRVNAIIDSRALHEIYLEAFEYIVKTAEPIGVMTSYNKINGVFSSENPLLLTEMLRHRWDFKGMVISDWGGVPNPVAASKAGLDLQMPQSPSSLQLLREEILSGQLDEKCIDNRVAHILASVFRIAKMEEDKNIVHPKAVPSHVLAEEAAADSVVMLKNELNCLPLCLEQKRIAVIGRLAKAPVYQGTGCAVIHTETVDTPFACLTEHAFKESRLSYCDGYLPNGETTRELLEAARKKVEVADIAIVFIGSALPQESDHYDRNNLKIMPGHEQLMEMLVQTKTPLCIIIQSGDVVAMPWIEQVDAVLLAGFGGEGIGEALAQVLFGQVTPNGKLPVSIPRNIEDTPSFDTFPGDGFDLLIGESIFTGYRYYDHRGRDPLFPFGFGLSYTTFAYSNLRISRQTISFPDILKVQVDIENTGDYDGKEIVELYIAQKSPKLPRPVRELKGFDKIFLAKKERKTVEFELEERDFAYFDSQRDSWVVDEDEFSIEIGASSRDIRTRTIVTVHPSVLPVMRLSANSGFPEIMDNPISRKMLFDFLIEHEVISEAEMGEPLEKALYKSFWGIFSYFDMNSNGKITFSMVEKLVEEMNLALSI